MTPGLRVEVEIDLAGHPLVVEFGQQRRDQAQAGIHVGEDAGHSGASSQFPVDAFQPVGGTQTDTVRSGEVEHRQGFRNRGFGPLGQFRMLLAPGVQGGFQKPLGFCLVRSIEDRAQCRGDVLFRLLSGDELAGVLLQMELATLPGNRREQKGTPLCGQL